MSIAEESRVNDVPKKPMGSEEGLYEPHFTCKQLGAMWNMSESTIYRMFAGEKGIVKLNKRSARKRTRVEFRIPKSVADRVYRSLAS